MAENRELALCSVCKVEKPREAFNLSRTTTRGISNRCRDCGIVYMKCWHERNKVHSQNYAKEYNARTTVRRAATFKNWYERNKGKQQAKALDRVRRDRELSRAKCREWAKKNLEHRRKYRKENRLRYRAAWQRRRALERAAEGRWVPSDIEKILIAQSGRCAYCLKMLGADFQVDHVIPLSKGGSNWPSNLALACPTCNRKKSARLDMKPFLQVLNG